MEEAPLIPPESVPNPPSPDPEKLGNVLMRFEIPGPEKLPTRAPLADEQAPATNQLRDGLRSGIDYLKRQKLNQAVELSKEQDKNAELHEVTLDRRTEAIDNSSEPTTEATELTPGSFYSPRLQSVGSQLPPSSRSLPIQPNPTRYNQAVPTNQPTVFYKKPLIIGLLAGVATGLALVLVYALK